MSVSPRKTRSATGALRNRNTAPAPVARPAKKGRAVSTSKVKTDIPLVERLHNLLTDALTTAKSLEVTPDNRAALQNVRKIALSLLGILPGGEIPIRDLKYELHCVSLKSLAKELKTNQKYDSEDEADEQGPLMERIMKEVVEWLPDIWLAMAEENEDMDLIRGCLNLCSSAANDLGEEFDCTDRLVITNSGKKMVYNQSYYVVDYMAWVWREFLVFSVIRRCPVSACEVIKDDEIYEQVFSLFRRNTSDPKNGDGYAFSDDHWSQEMKTVADRLYAERHNHRTTKFIEQPSFRLYISLVSKYPDIESSILSAIRERLLLDKPFIRYSDAAEILATAHQTEDIIRLLDHLTEKDFRLHTPAILVIVRYLSKISDKKHCSHALQIVENGLKRSKREALDAVNHLFPSLADAQLWLRNLRDAGSFTFDDDIFHDNYDERDTNLRHFAERAANGGPLTDPNWAPPAKNRKKVYSEESYYEVEPQSSERDLAQSIRGWAQVLNAWPDQKAAAEVWNRVKFDDSELLFSAVSGAEEALMDHIEQADSVQSDKWLQSLSPRPAPKSRNQILASMCTATAYDHYYDSPSYVYGYVTDGMQALIKTFIRQDHRAALRK